MLTFINGILVGFAAAIALLLVLFIITNFPPVMNLEIKNSLPLIDETLTPFPKEIKSNFEKWLKTEQIVNNCDWPNLVMSRMFIALRLSILFRKKWARKVIN
jgi:uncharacterized membrane protein